ncbi:MAG: peptide MFS transporter [Prolixibacteraceae bacterium]|nr:peptide MFS transporter [Prolixibacteraceae bacterium]MBN2773905.1 peptide MFS transporter [Prolixibacteraceae bacterium]
MFKDHPKGLIVAFFANMGERFGFYTMMACLVLFLQAQYNLSPSGAGDYYSWFYFAIYALALLGGVIADKTKKYKTVILVGIVLMFVGYIFMSIPKLTLWSTLGALFVIALGNGMFKGNLQALVGQMYDDPKYAHLRDRAYSWFYMGINVGALFAPHAANGIRNWFLKSQGFIYNQNLAELSNLYKTNPDSVDLDKFRQAAEAASLNPIGVNIDYSAIANKYLDVFSHGYNYAFAIAAISMIISLVVYLFWKRLLPNKSMALESTDGKEKSAQKQVPKKPLAIVWAVIIGVAVAVAIYFTAGGANSDPDIVKRAFNLAFAAGMFLIFALWILQVSSKEERPRISALLLVFVVVIFFWMAFHQNGLTMNYFARDFTVRSVGKASMLLFNVWTFLALGIGLSGLVYILRKKSTQKERLFGALATVAGIVVIYLFYRSFGKSNSIQPEIFQHFNPFYIVFLTAPVVGFFVWLNKKGKEPSTPRKIGIGMILASVAFLVLLIGSLDLASYKELKDAGTTLNDSARVSQWWLIGSYFVITIAELFLSPMGLSFVSKVSPIRFQGLMQGGWLAATAVGNKLLFVGSDLYEKINLWKMWSVFIILCLLSAAFIFIIMKRLERLTK